MPAVVLQMGKNGGEPRDTILTLEEALKRFARKRLENSETRDAAVQASHGSKVRYADFSASTKPEQEKLEETAGIARVHPPAPAVTGEVPGKVQIRLLSEINALQERPSRYFSGSLPLSCSGQLRGKMEYNYCDYAPDASRALIP